MEQSHLQAGKVVSTHGTRGEIRILPWADGPAFLLSFDTLYLDGQPYAVAHSSVQKTCVLCKLVGVDDVTAAAALRGKTVSIDRSAVTLEEGTYFIADLIGLRVYDGEQEIGKVREVIPMPAGDVLVVKGAAEYWIPNVKAFVQHIDLGAGRIDVHLIEGLQIDAD